jgi:hypothetical protein
VIGGEQYAVDCLGEGDVATVVCGEVEPKFPDPGKEGAGREYLDWEGDKVADGSVGLVRGQLTGAGVAP